MPLKEGQGEQGLVHTYMCVPNRVFRPSFLNKIPHQLEDTETQLTLCSMTFHIFAC